MLKILSIALILFVIMLFVTNKTHEKFSDDLFDMTNLNNLGYIINKDIKTLKNDNIGLCNELKENFDIFLTPMAKSQYKIVKYEDDKCSKETNLDSSTTHFRIMAKTPEELEKEFSQLNNNDEEDINEMPETEI